MPHLTIRSAQPGDEDLILSLVRELADYERLLHEVKADAVDMAKALFGPAPRAFCQIALWQDQPAGFAFWFYNFSTFSGSHGIYLEDLFVRPAFRGKKIGKALLASLAERCVAENLGGLTWSVLDWNEPSIAFYKGHGAVMLDDWTTCKVSGDALKKLAGLV